MKLALDSFHHRLGCCCRCKKAGAKSNAKNIGAGVENRWCCVCAKSEVGEKKKAKIKKQFRTLSKKKILGSLGSSTAPFVISTILQELF